MTSSRKKSERFQSNRSPIFPNRDLIVVQNNFIKFNNQIDKSKPNNKINYIQMNKQIQQKPDSRQESIQPEQIEKND